MADATTVAGHWSGFRELGWEGMIDGARFVVERGVDGDHRFVHGAGEAVHHLSADGSLLLCVPSLSSDPSWWRVVLDSVLFSAALLNGYEALHAGAVATREGVIAIVGGTGGGKSTLLTEMLGPDVALMADDVLVLKPCTERAPLAYPGPPLMTVPRARVPASAETILAIEDERWIAFPAHPEPEPLMAVVLLERRADVAPSTSISIERIASPLAALLGALMRFPRTPERERSRFELAADLAGHVPLWRLRAGLDASPAALVEALRNSLVMAA
jgi:hypothetical protein